MLRDHMIHLEVRLLQVFHRGGSEFDSRSLYVGFVYGKKKVALWQVSSVLRIDQFVNHRRCIILAADSFDKFTRSNKINTQLDATITIY